MATGKKIESIIDKNDRILQRLEDGTIARLNASLESAYKQLEKELLKAYQTHSGNKSLLPSQRKLLILNEVQSLLRLVNPGNEQAIQQAFEQLLTQSFENGFNLAQQLTEAIANEQLQSFSEVPLQAAVLQAQESRNRLKNHSEQFASRASAIVEMGLIQGSGVQKVARQLRQELGIAKGRSEAIARTESLSSLNQAAQQVYKEGGIDYIQSIATSDSRTCGLCVSRNMRVYKLGAVAIPYHVRCRCYSLPWKKEWQKLGLTDDEWAVKFNEQINEELLAAGKKPDPGLSPFEKSAGILKPPIPVWEPGGIKVMEQKTQPQEHSIPIGGIYPKLEEITPETLIARGKEVAGNIPEIIDRLNATQESEIKQIEKDLKAASKQVKARYDKEALKLERKKPTEEQDPLVRQELELRAKKNNFYSDRIVRKFGAMEDLRDALISNGLSKQDAATRLEAIDIDTSCWKGKGAKLKETIERELTDFFRLTNGNGASVERMGYYDDRAWASKNGTLNLGDIPTDTTLYHELGHFVEFESSEVRDAVNDWMYKRATGSPKPLNEIVQNGRYEDDEMSLPGKFINPYVGKVYSDRSTEVVSMGLERFVDGENMSILYQNDPDHFYLILGILRR